MFDAPCATWSEFVLISPIVLSSVVRKARSSLKMERNLRKILGDTVGILTAQNGQEALQLLAKTTVNVVFMDVIICTAHKDFAYKAWDLFISGYLLKPASIDSLREALDHLRTPIVEQLTVHCFGSFEVFYRGEIVRFPRRGAKELFAYLVDPELKKTSIRKYVMELRRTFSALGLDDVLCHTRDNYFVNTARLDCDLYRFLDGDASARKLYVGEYMSQYSWAESTIGYIENHFQ